MNRSPKIVSKQLIIALGFCISTLGTFAQKQSRIYKESFNVNQDAVLDINTSYADIEFETWNKNTVEVEAVIELEGAEKEEAENYFENDPIKILGNSSRIEITSGSSKFGLFGPQNFEFEFGDLDIEIPEIAPFVVEIPEIAPFPEIVEMPRVPPLPLTEAYEFDYKAYQKDGEKYMKKWQEEFKKSFDEKHQKKLEEWAKRMEERGKELEERMEEREKRREEMEKRREELMEQRIEKREELQKVRQEERKARQEELMLKRRHEGPNIFYFSTDGENKNFKIKKTIKIKMPKSTKIKMNVRHGEVKLAENTRNLNATLSHSSLWATTIDGDETQVSVSYSPVSVRNWNYGQLKTNYSKDIELTEVGSLQLQANSSDVTINKLLKKAFIKNDFGPLKIISISNDFEEMDVSLKNAELNCKLPTTATTVYVKGTSSELVLPKSLNLKETKNGNTKILKGYHLSDNSNRSIVITSDYSEVSIQ
ncbi:hypothetical protein NYZ99_05845 [Maribacter litopenaei]|uniref:Adhesin domain-containing protein n=1 Tax=Maribacter litopenaei TaxID=2976127 RepID=A0ABY5YDF4_9FLAO|nr:hypothetical protein [Maribacter litopenaei]UWX55906.1 hypothetical protein NYZ99_05845 [Maribacter litopenaei]